MEKSWFPEPDAPSDIVKSSCYAVRKVAKRELGITTQWSIPKSCRCSHACSGGGPFLTET